MKPFFLWYGGKWRLAEKLTPPQHDLVIEPFAGSLGFSTFYNCRKVVAVDADPVVVGIWSYLIKVSAKEIMRLPANIMSVEELPSSAPQEAKWLIGMWFNAAIEYPALRRANWARQPRFAYKFWGETIKTRIASQLEQIRDWKVIQGSYEVVSDLVGHFHIDAPYNNSTGESYRHHKIDYTKLASWCRTRKGYIQCCESSEATWLPFVPYSIMGTHRFNHYTAEAVWESRNS